MNLSDMKAAIPPSEPERTTAVDISEQLGEEAGRAVIVLRELDAPRMFQVEADGKIVKKMRPRWPRDLQRACAVLGLAHVSPRDADTTPLDFYVTLAEDSKALFQHILTAYGKAFPAATEDEDEEDSKND
jgi:hypothetical protein